MTFTLDGVEAEAAAQWISEHEAVCPLTETGAIGGKTSFCFTQTGIGVIAIVRCACGAEQNVTDFSEW